MGQYTRKQVVEEAEKLAKMLANIEEIDRFKQLEEKLNENEKVQGLIKRIKALQKQAVNFQHYGKHEALKKVEAELNRLQDELDNIPVVAEFKDSQVIINDILQMITNTIAREVTNEVIRSTGGDVLGGETGSAKQHSPSCH
ncbi:RicAFT regulatory complex protein RicA family protein [Salirhabdus salicampi]|uniref:RicAFT regulatory complex protein RicA family protein n=1 Tax=Salirhabdus salicampi TaxID=476102 RepID=UPI0020C239C0|nr:YlbF family regulator [Salirhabdus salicampi]MCP8616443.1 YlbF family regulator [Salirhabdus salicampi]